MSIKAQLNAFDATMIVVSLVIGIGIFRTPAIVAYHTGSVSLFFTAWVLGGVLSLLGALTFAEVGSRYPHPGSFYKVVATSYHPVVAFMLNWTNVTIVNGAGTAAVAMIGAEYLVPILLPPEFQPAFGTQLTAAGLTLFLLVMNYLGMRTGAWVQNVLTVIKILMIVALGLAAVALGGAPNAPISAVITSSPWWIALGAGLVSVFYTYGGYQNTINFGGDIRDPARTMPRAIFFGIGIIITLYLFINIAYVSVLGMDGVTGAALVAAELARAVVGSSGFTFVSLAIFLSAMGFVNVTLMQIPRAYYAMAEDGTLPAAFMRVNSRTQAQEFTLLFFGAIVLLSIFFLGTFERLLNYVMLFDSLNNAIVASTIFVLRSRRIGDVEPIYRAPFFPLLPAVFIVFLLAVTASVILSQPGSLIPGLGIVAAGWPLYILMRRFNRKPEG
jgi:APA family basic amino acid/polyamine antiporter